MFNAVGPSVFLFFGYIWRIIDTYDMFLFKPFEGVYGSLRLNEVKGSSNRQPDGFPAHLWGDKPPTRGFLPPSNTHTDTQSRYQQHHWCQLQQRGENHRISGFSPTVWVCRRKNCVCYHSLAPCSSWQLALPTLGPGVHTHTCMCVRACVYCLGILGAGGQNLPGVDCQVPCSPVLNL